MLAITVIILCSTSFQFATAMRCFDCRIKDEFLNQDLTELDATALMEVLMSSQCDIGKYSLGDQLVECGNTMEVSGDTIWGSTETVQNGDVVVHSDNSASNSLNVGTSFHRNPFFSESSMPPGCTSPKVRLSKDCGWNSRDVSCQCQDGIGCSDAARVDHKGALITALCFLTAYLKINFC